MVKKILIVDDEFDDLNAAKSVLEKDYDVEMATNGAQALDLLRGSKFDLILIDIKMPTLSGYDLLRIMREKLNHHVKIVYVSIVPKQDVDMTDVDGFVQKPFSPKSISDAVKKALKKK